ncbi:hypothetical protein EJB05_20696, partial [Eragrostis curvula]
MLPRRPRRLRRVALRTGAALPVPPLRAPTPRRRRRALAVSHPLERPFHLVTLENSGGWCVGSSGAWLAVLTLFRHANDAHAVALVNPLTGQELALPPMRWDRRRLEPTWPFVRCKVVFAPDPRQDDFTAVSVCGEKTLAYVSAGDASWSFQEITWVDTEIADVVYCDGDGGSKFYCLTKSGAVIAVHVPRSRGTKQLVLKPLLPGISPSDPNDVFPPPYARVSRHTSAKYLVFCEGNMYQVWRNTGGAVDLELSDGRGSFRVSKNAVFVLRYAPAWRGPCWEAVQDLGGRSVFVGLNNAVTVRAEGTPGVKGNCVYWASEFEREEAIVFDMQTRKATPCLAPSVGATCWYLPGATPTCEQK